MVDGTVGYAGRLTLWHNVGMPNFRRARVEGGTFFFTVVTDNRTPFLCDAGSRRLLRKVLHGCQARWPMEVEAIVLLPDHLHTIWTLPAGDTDYSRRWAWTKKEFTREWLQSGYVEHAQTTGRHRDGRRGVWQPKFWEHTIRDECDLRRHIEYIHYNPVKHGVTRCPHAWRWSSFDRWVRAGVYPVDWACSSDRIDQQRMDFSDLDATVGE
jgi:putative transposase